MLTYDQAAAAPVNELEAMRHSSLEDDVEVGEDNTFWLHARRSAGLLVLTSKQTGRQVLLLPPAEALDLGLINPVQFSAAQGALRL